MKISKGPDKNVQQGIDLFIPLFTPFLIHTHSRGVNTALGKWSNGLVSLSIRDHFKGVWVSK